MPYPEVVPGTQSHEDVMLDRLRRDSRLSYRFSQGVPGSQSAIYKFLAAYYVETTTEFGAEMLGVVLPKFESDEVGTLRLPTQHISMHGTVLTDDSTEVQLQFKYQLPEFVKTVREAFDHTDLRAARLVDSARSNAVQTWAVETVVSDLKYQEAFRTTAADPHASLFRQHAILGRETGSPAFNYLCQAGYKYLSSCNPEGWAPLMLDLESAWNENHPGQTFFPSTE